MKHIITLVSLFLSLSSSSQSIVEDSIYFEHNNSFRKIKIWLPEDYLPSTTYQTIYCLDADLLFNPLVSSAEIYSYPDIAKMPPTIVVGLYFDERNNDMGINWETGVLNSDGLQFKKLIADQLIPKIESDYNVSSYRSIVGHSNSSSYIQFFLKDSIPVFQGYLSMSEYELPKDEALFCSIQASESRPIDFVYVTAKKDAEYRVKSGFRHETILDSCSQEHLKSTHLVFDNADHISMVPQGMPLGLETLYADFSSAYIEDDQLLLKMKGEKSPLEYMDDLVHARASKYGIQANYSFDDVNNLYQLYVIAKDSINMSHATSKYAELFKDSSEYFYEAQSLEMIGAYHSAEQSYLKHLSYYSSPGEWSYKRIVWLYMGKLKQPKKALEWASQGYVELDNTDFIDLIVKIALKNEQCKKNAQSMLKNYIKNASTEERKEFLNSKRNLIN
ncbi:MAG: putative alpha/beta superfamily hydrolase [Crocinitomicaceae bacterium]|jgi:predicted alpha/beta superfamily hydrolase